MKTEVVMNEINGKRYINVQELSILLQVKIKTIYAWVEAKAIPFYKFGALIRFDPEEIETWIKQHKIDPLIA